MNKEGSIGAYEAICLLSIITITKLFYSSISAIVTATGTSSWYATLISCSVSLLLFSILYALLKRFPGQNIIEIFENVLGKVLGKILALLFTIYFVFYTGSVLREFIEMIKVYNLPYTPPSIIMAMFLIVVVFLIYYGFEVLARISVLCFFPFMIGLLLILLLSYKNYNAYNLAPYLGYGIKPTLYYGVLRSSAYDEFFMLAVVINSLHGLKTFKKASITSLVLVGITNSVTLLCYIMVFGYDMGKEYLSGLFEIARGIILSRFVERLEPIFLFIWVSVSVISVSVALYVSISIYCKTFAINKTRPLILPFIFLTFMVAILPKSLVELINVNIKIMRQYSMLFIYTTPIVILLIALMRGKRGDKPSAEKV